MAVWLGDIIVNDGACRSESWKSKSGAGAILWVPEVTSFQPLSSWEAPLSHLISTQSTCTLFLTVRFLKLEMEMIQVLWDVINDHHIHQLLAQGLLLLGYWGASQCAKTDKVLCPRLVLGTVSIDPFCAQVCVFVGSCFWFPLLLIIE